MRPLLLVEDDPDDAELFRVAAQDAGLPGPIQVATDGEKALAILHEERLVPAAVVLDLKMPGIGGLEVLRRLREDAATRALKIFVLTSSDLERDQSEARRLGCDDYLVKPTSLADYVKIAGRIKVRLEDGKSSA